MTPVVIQYRCINDIQIELDSICLQMYLGL